MSDEEHKKSKLRELYAYRTKLIEKREGLLKDKTSIDSHLKDIDQKLDGVQKGIDHIENRKLFISTHAIQRYCERVNPDANEDIVRAHVVTPQLLNMVQTLGNGVYPVDGLEVVVEDNKIITIQVPYSKQKPTGKSFVKPRNIKPRKYR